MASNLADRIAQARHRLTTALLKGEDAATHRQALEALEATQEAEEAKQREAIEQASQDRQRGIAAAALAIPTRPSALDTETT